MCGRFARAVPIEFSASAAEALHALDPDADVQAAIDACAPQFNLAPSMSAAVIARDGAHGLGVRTLRWGLVPSWARDLRIGNRAINARVETVAQKPMFRAAFRKRRCLVPMTGWYEWAPAAGGGKQPHFIHDAAGRALLCAGLWEGWKPPGDAAADWLRSFTLLTGRAGVVSGSIHDRQPIVLPPERFAAWLDGAPAAATAALTDLPEAALAQHPVDRRVGSPRHQDIGLLDPVSPPR